MTDPSSPIIDFYPTGMLILLICEVLDIIFHLIHILIYCADFEVDMNGKRYSWQVSYSSKSTSIFFICAYIISNCKICFAGDSKTALY